jgi:hypothetical protein
MTAIVKSEESKVAVLILLTFSLLLITNVFPQYMIMTTAAMIALGVILGIYLWATSRKSGERKDERSERCSLLASRNEFLAGIVLTALLAVLVQAGSPVDMLSALRSIWALGMAAYFLWYLAYKRVAMA